MAFGLDICCFLVLDRYMSNYNVTVSRFSLPIFGVPIARAVDSIGGNTMSVFVVSNNVNDATELVCESCASAWVTKTTNVDGRSALPVVGTLSVEFVGLEWTFARASEFNANDTCPWCLGTLIPSTLTISIGRNVPGERADILIRESNVNVEWNSYLNAYELRAESWLDFQQCVESIFRNGKAETRALGVSVWCGVEEETCMFQWFNAPRPTIEQIKELRELADNFGQESVAVTYATPEFI